MPKLQWSAPSSLGEVVGRVQIKARSKSLAIEYLLYLARFEPTFPKKSYLGEKNHNCTLSMEDRIYGSHFDDYREKRSPPLTTQRAFFEDALTRGASMYDAGFRLSDPKKPAASSLLVSSEWLEMADRIGAVADIMNKGSGDYDAYALARREAPTSVDIGLFLIRLFSPSRKTSTEEIQRLEKLLRAFASAAEVGDRRQFGSAIMNLLMEAYGRPLQIENWDELAAPTEAVGSRQSGMS